MPEGNQPSSVILVAQDGSPAARNAARIAVQIARSQDLGIRGIYVVDEALVLDVYANYQAELGGHVEPASRTDLIARFEERGEFVLAWLESCCREADVTFGKKMELGGVPEVILREAPRTAILALGRRGQSHALDPHHLGTHFRTIAHHSSQPLLVGGDQQQPIQRILLAYNGSERAQRALDWAARLSRTLQAEVVVLTVQEDGVSDSTQHWMKEAQARLIENGVTQCRFLERTGQAAVEIVAEAAASQADMIIIGRYRHTALLEWLVGSTVDQVLRNSPLPVFVA